MKKISTLLASLVLTVSVFATERPKSLLMITAVDRADLKVIVDGQRFEPNHNSVRIDNLDAGVHQVKIYQQKNNGVFSIFGKQYQAVFNGTVFIKAKAITTISIDRFGNATVSRGRMASWYDGQANNGFDQATGSGDYDQGGHFGNYDNHAGYRSEMGMNDREFSAVLQSISKEWLESNKMKSATQIVTNNELSAGQVKQLALLFSIEDNKLDLAKQAYANTVDKENYSMIYAVFSFDSSKDELARFIRTCR